MDKLQFLVLINYNDQSQCVDHHRCDSQADPSSFIDNMIDLLCGNFSSPEFGTKLQREVPLFLEIPKFHHNTVYDGWKEASTAKISLIHPVVLIQY